MSEVEMPSFVIRDYAGSIPVAHPNRSNMKIFVDRYRYSHSKRRAFFKKQVKLGTVKLLDWKQEGWLYEIIDLDLNIPTIRK